MLPKPDKSQKKSADPKQLDFVDTLSHETKVRRKRKIIIIALILTIGTSLGLWSYRTLKSTKINFSLPNLRTISTPAVKNGSPDFDKIVNSLISADKNSWSFYLAVNTKKVWSKNDSMFTPDSLKLQPKSPSTTLISVLPSGAEVKEQITKDTPNQFQIIYLITIPQKEIFIAVDISGTNNLDNSKKLLPSVIEKIYWTLVSTLN